MLDGVKIWYYIHDFDAWKQAVNINMFTATNSDTGEIKQKCRQVKGAMQKTITCKGNFETYLLTIKQVEKCFISGKKVSSYLIIIDGSFHKNYFKGTNYLPLTWHALQTEINHLEKSLHLDANIARPVNIEIGVNIKVSFPVFPYLKKNLLNYKGNPFHSYKPDREGIRLGYVCDELSQYSVKIYDKGLQNNLPENLLRFELRFLKMQKLKRQGIRNLSDLYCIEKIKQLLNLLLRAWDDVLLYDSSLNVEKGALKRKDKQFYERCNNSKYWENLKESDLRKFNSERQKLRKIIAAYGTNEHERIKKLIKDQWNELFKNCTNLPCVKEPELYNFTVKVNDKNVQNWHSNTNNEFSYTIKKKKCLSCGRDITNQNSGSRFCSSKFVGEQAAHKCRNINSNTRNNFKRKIARINSKGVLFDVMPFLIDNNNKKQPYAF